jgi:ribosomal RNA-processing protein 12
MQQQSQGAAHHGNDHNHGNDNDDGDDQPHSSSSSFAHVIQTLTAVENKKTTTRGDPRSKRLAAVTAAIVEIAASSTQNTQDDDISAAVVYSHTMTALEGTLSSKISGGNGDGAAAAVCDSLSTQVALLELLAVTVPYIEPARTILIATLPLTSRILRALVVTCQAVDTSSLHITENTMDERGSVNAVLRGSCRATSQILQQLLLVLKAPLSTQQQRQQQQQLSKLVPNFLQETLLTCLHDKRPKVRKAAQQGMLEILTTTTAATCSGNSSSNNACLNLIRKSITTFLHAILQQTLTEEQQKQQAIVAAASSTSSTADSSRSISDNGHAGALATVTTNCAVLHHLSFLEKCIVHLTVAQQQRLSTDVMELLTATFAVSAAAATAATVTSGNAMDFVAIKSHRMKNAAQQQEQQGATLLLVELLSVVLVMMQQQQQEAGSTTSTLSVELAPRVLASLLTAAGAQPMWIFRRANNMSSSGGVDADVLQRGRIVYGQVLLAALQQLLTSASFSLSINQENSTKAVDLTLRLLPPCLQMMLLLCKQSSLSSANETSAADSAVDFAVSQTLFAEWTQIMRTSLPAFLQQANCGGKMPATNPQPAALLAKCLQDSTKSLVQVVQPMYNHTWSVSLTSLVVWVQQALLPLSKSENAINGHGSTHCSLVVESLVQLRIDEGVGTKHIAAIDDALSTLVQGVGLEVTWTKWIRPWLQQTATQEQEVIRMDRAWILPLLKTAATTAQPHSPTLGFFQDQILALARDCDRVAYGSTSNKSSITKKQKKMQNFYHARVVDLWAFLPCACDGPTDIVTRLPSLTITLAKALDDSTRYPQLIAVICHGLTTLSKSLQRQGELNDDVEKVINETVVKLLPVMFKIVTTPASSAAAPPVKKGGDGAGDEMDVDNDEKQATTMPIKPSTAVETVTDQGQQTQIIGEAVSALCVHAPKPFLQGLFKKLMQRLLEEVQSDDSKNGEKMCSLLSLTQALVSSGVLEDESISFLYRALKPFIRNDEYGARAQKRAYKVLAVLCEQHNSFFVKDMNRLEELTSLLTSSIATCQVAPRYMRLKCLGIVVEVWGEEEFDVKQKDHLNQISKTILAEVLLYLKDSNAKTRQTAYELVLSLAKKGNISDFLRVVSAALGAETAHMRSAGVMALSRIVYEFAWQDENLQALLPSLLNTVLVLINDNSREVIKSVVGFIRISVAAIPPAQLEPLLPDLIGSLLSYHKIKDRFRAKIVSNI